MNWTGLFLTIGITWGLFFVVGLIVFVIAKHINTKEKRKLEKLYQELSKEIKLEDEKRTGNS